VIDRPGPILCLVTDRRRLAPDARTEREAITALEDQLAIAIDAGVDLIQIRERDLPAGILVDLVRRVVTRAQATSVVVVVNDRADVALAAAAGGVHLRSDGPPIERVRGLGARGWLVGRSTHSAAEAATHGRADYLLLGTVFPSESKQDGASTIGLDGLRAAVGAGRAPILAIGGVNPTNAPDCVAAGARGIAAIGAFLPEGRARGALGARRAVEAFRAHLHTEPRSG
jgi:thiamine-phosphate pyrophosphorylase